MAIDSFTILQYYTHRVYTLFHLFQETYEYKTKLNISFLTQV